MTILDFPATSRIRRNHGLEHASLNILNQRFPERTLAGYSSPSGFFVLGDLATEDLREAVMQALTRLQTGERHLAIHPNCGTNYIASGFVAGLLAWLGMAGAKSKREKVDRLPFVIALAMLGFIIGQPLGPKIQERITTSGDPEGMTIVDVFPVKFGRLTLHRVVTQG
ncbi:MAG: DUF6391 domain-containing protein [Anaerolineales bacterium]|nr:DUF6391 domain-containing protein [Anaerolineales bacterium]MDO9348742.1 DUF6391 domain-containing protein [Anaerolineales bacterium]MDP2974756.1 DUF6391 domain-containing protein [Anaerolineales bacterium]